MNKEQKITVTAGILYILCTLIGGTIFVFMIGITQSMLLAFAGLLLIVSGNLKDIYLKRRINEVEEGLERDFKCKQKN